MSQLISFQIYLTYLNLIVQGLIPFALLVGLNTRIYLQVIKSIFKHIENNDVHAPALQIKRLNGLPHPGFSQREPGKVRDVRNTQISLAIAGVFLVCHSVRWIPNIWELQQTVTEQVGVLQSLLKVFLYFMECCSFIALKTPLKF